jgi:two-component system phosphate regulon response regulator PhoB
LVVEDEPAIAELIAINLRHNGFRLTLAMDSESAQREIDAVLPDIILLDWMLPGESGLVLAKRWRNHPRTKAVPIIMLTARSDEVDRVAGLDAGADDYISKPFSIKELIARVRAVLRRRTPERVEGSVSIGALLLDAQTYRVSFNEQMLKLGPTEFKLLHYLMTHAERVHTRSKLLDRVWGDHVFIEERTVDVHVKRLRESLGPQAGLMIETVRGAGYRISAHVDLSALPPSKLPSNSRGTSTSDADTSAASPTLA